MLSLKPNVSIYFDQRRAKSNGKYPVKLNVYDRVQQKKKLFSTDWELTKDEFDNSYKAAKPSGTANKELKRQLEALRVKADSVARQLNPFTFQQFEKVLFRKPGDEVKISYHFKQFIQEFKSNGQISTANTYELSEKSIKTHLLSKNKQSYDSLTFHDITSDWLSSYEKEMTLNGKSLTTVSIYLRALRALFNRAIAENEIDREIYPFGKRKYEIPSSQNVKKALSLEQLKILFEAEPDNVSQEKAKAFWFFSYASNGMNMKDIALLRFRDVQEDKIVFYRAKTLNTSKKRLKPITAYLNDFTRSVINQYGKELGAPDDFIFDIIKPNLTPEKQQAKIKNFTRFVNQHLKTLCSMNGLPTNISTYWARHSFATIAVRKGATLEFIQESLGHGNITTTQNYFAGFDSNTKKAFSESVMDFEKKQGHS